MSRRPDHRSAKTHFIGVTSLEYGLIVTLMSILITSALTELGTHFTAVFATLAAHI